MKKVMKLESLEDLKFEKLDSSILSKTYGGQAEKSENISITRDGGQTWESCPERAEIVNGLIVCREVFYDGVWNDYQP